MQRLIRTPAGVEAGGRPLDDADGVAAGPGGEEVRQVVQDRIAWECSTWCSADGVVYDRFHDPFRDAFVWSAPKAVGVDATTGHFTTVVGHDTDLKRSVRLVRAIALAWLEPPRTGVKLQAAVLPGRPPVAANLVWARTGVRSVEAEGEREEPRARPNADDAWRPLRYAWRNLCGEVVARVDESARPAGERYEVSLRGWVRSPHGGACTRGTRTPSGRRYASLVELGAVWIDEAVLASFAGDDEGDAAHDQGPPTATAVRHLNGDASDDAYANLRRVRLLVSQPRHDETVALLAGRPSLPDVCAALGVARSTAWGRIATAARELPLGEASAALAPLAPAFVRDAVRQKMEDGDLDAADPLARALDALDDALASHPTWPRLERDDRYGVLKLARTLTLRTRASERASAPR